MKKLITFCFFAFAILIGSQGVEAQNLLEINNAASEKTRVIRKTIKLTKEQTEDVYQAYRTYETTYQKISGDLDNNKETFEKINTVLDARLKEILSEEQFSTYINLYRTDE